MEDLLGRIASQSVSFAIRSGIGVVSSFAIRETTRYIRTVKGKDREELEKLQARLKTKINIISPAIDLVEIISARGNTSLENSLSLTKTLRHDIQSLGQRVANATSVSESKLPKGNREDIKAIMDDIRILLHRIEDAVPLINLAVTTSGVNLSTSIPHTVSPSRLLQASMLLNAGDSAYALDPSKPVQIGTAFNLTLYMLFAGHTLRRENLSARDLTWQEVISKCRVKLVRTPLVFDDEDDYHQEGENDNSGVLIATQALRAKYKADEFCYELCLIEDLDDGRLHEEEGKELPESYEDVEKAGIRARIPIHQISKMFYTNSGKLLGIDETNSPVLLLKRDINAMPPRKLLDRANFYGYGLGDENEEDSEDHSSNYGDPVSHEEDDAYGLPKHLDREWLAFEVWSEQIDEEGLGDEDEEEGSHDGSYDSQLEAAKSDMAGLSLQSATVSTLAHRRSSALPPSLLSSVPIKSSLSLLECLLRLANLQNFQQTSHLAVHDELLNLFLSDGNSWLGSHESREREREYAKQRIGFDPFGSPSASGDEGAQSISGARNQIGKLKKPIKQLPNTQVGSELFRGRGLLPTASKTSPSFRSNSPGAQLRVEGSIAHGENQNRISHSYPSTPVAASSRLREELRYVNSSSKVQAKNNLGTKTMDDSTPGGKRSSWFQK